MRLYYCSLWPILREIMSSILSGANCIDLVLTKKLVLGSNITNGDSGIHVYNV